MDPACGSGHILVYAFDLLFEIYKEQGYAERDIPALILEHNLHGLDIDERAVQLASFSVLMKARAKNSRILRRSPKLNIATVRSTQNLSLPAGKALVESDWRPLLEVFKEANSLGSLITPPALDGARLLAQVDTFEADNPVFGVEAKSFRELVKQAQLLEQQYLVVVANPPYMSGRSFDSTLKDFVLEYYRRGKDDLFAAFLERCLEQTQNGGLTATINQHSWMFLSSYEKLRTFILDNCCIQGMLHLGYGVFKELNSKVVQSTAFVISKKDFSQDQRGVYLRLIDFQGDGDRSRAKTLEAIANPGCGYLYYAKSADFRKIPGSAIAYSVSSEIVSAYEHKKIGDHFTLKEGVGTRNDDRFIRFFWEISSRADEKKWEKTDKAGQFRKWYGNCLSVMNWKDDGSEIRNYRNPDGSLKSRPQNTQFLFLEAISWGKVTSGSTSFRYRPEGWVFNDGAPSIFGENKLEVMSFLNSKVTECLLNFQGGTLNVTTGLTASLPFVIPENIEKTTDLSVRCVEIAKTDWDNFETSWDFHSHIFYGDGSSSVAEAFALWKHQSETNLKELQHLEEENNRYWINAYGLQDELTPEVPDDQITIRRADLSRDIRSFISYAIGCTMGRYSLDAPGLIHAGQPFDPKRHTTFPADPDAIIPITDQAYFTDDIVTRFIEFVKVTYGEATLTENLDFIANALKLRASETAQDRIRRYFVTEFISDHIKTYKKRPIYWLFTSGKAGSRRSPAFSALVYLHRYSEDTVARIRTDYVLELQVKLDEEIKRADADADTATTTTAKKVATKRLQTLKDQQLELRDYQAKLQTIADQRISLDLDDGVAYNYTLFEGLVYEGSDLKMADLKKKSQWKRDLLAAQSNDANLG